MLEQEEIKIDLELKFIDLFAGIGGFHILLFYTEYV